MSPGGARVARRRRDRSPHRVAFRNQICYTCSMSNLTDEQIWIPGKAYETLLSAPFTKAKDQESKRVTRALAAGERRNKGRGYRVLCTLSQPKACFLAAYMHEFISSPAYSALGTADALAVRTLRDRLDEMCAPSQAQVARVENLAKAREVAAANREQAREPKIEAAKQAAQAYADWCKRDAFISQNRAAGIMLPREPMPKVDVNTYKTLDEHAPTWKPENRITIVNDDLKAAAKAIQDEREAA